MSKAGKLVKGLVKAKKESVMGKLGDSPFEDPMDQWSVKYNSPVRNEEVEQLDEIGDTKKGQKLLHAVNRRAVNRLTSKKADKDPKYAKKAQQTHWSADERLKEEVEQLDEDGWLFKYIRSLGYNPEVMPFAVRAKYARTTAFKHYKQAHSPDGTATDGIAEEAQQIDELNKDTLQRYKTAAHKSISATAVKRHAGQMGSTEYRKTMDKRSKGINRADADKRLGTYADKTPKKIDLSPYGAHIQKQYHEDVEHLAEAGTGLLMQFIKAKGLNPLTMDGNQKHAYARSSEFKIFKMKHQKEELELTQETSGMGERGEDWDEVTGNEVPKQVKEKKKIKEEADKTDTVTMDIPLLIRVLEYAREDAKTDMDLHKVVENLINMRGQGTLSMTMYNKIVAIKEQIERMDESFKVGDLVRPNAGPHKGAVHQVIHVHGDGYVNIKPHKLPTNQIKYGHGAARAHPNQLEKVNEDVEQIDELKASTYDSYINKVTDPKVASTRGKTPSGTLKSIKAIGGVAKAIGKKAKAELKELKKMPDNMDIEDHITRESVQVQEGIGGIEDSPMSATNSVKAMESAHRKGQMKSARMIKSLYKKKIKENLYDWEKDDKPKAKVVIQGGTTMTGQPRDTVEIEPVLKSRPNSAKPTN